MGEALVLISAIDAVAREATLFAAIWFLIGGLDDLAVDLIYWGRRILMRRRSAPSLAPRSGIPPAFAVFVAAWDESAVIGHMLRTALGRFDYPAYRIYVGTYPNDPATIAAVEEVASAFPRVRLVIGPLPGPTTKADCLNALWRALRADEAAGARFDAVILHDAEDVVHSLELDVFASLIHAHGAVQIPVLPLRYPGSRFVSGHYLDEFAEAHAKQLPVRQAVGAGLPLAGTGCAIRRDMLGRIADARGGSPFDATSLTEDYELGLTISAMGGAPVLARVPERPGGLPVAVRAYFPATLGAAVRQKARWMIGIALAGWDRTGWSEPGRIGDHWMRMRDRRATLAIPVLVVAYCALLFWGLSLAGHWAMRTPSPSLRPGMAVLLDANLALLAWRLAMRILFVRAAYGWGEALLSVPRMLVANYVALLAARKAFFDYLGMLRGAAPRWDKTAHHFPEEADPAA
ncbi:MAG: glycosyl transferase family protein [Sphingomonas sp.]|uniref:glycosyl transferase family protein n=1 Tax=Sphingomonas sp. TaxID=28214 RepID=UPI001B06BAC7|nr:glycosyl transferase family protein [Sphingomonas sp.]MBO9621752.1 glycosyl transferase family protein [Sphingomonas sp.]